MTQLNKDLAVDNVPVDALRPNTWNTNHVSPENETKIKASLERFGFVRPIIVRENPSIDGEYEILGGQHRWEVAIRMGYTQVPVINLGPIDDKTAKEIGLVDNGRYGEDDTLELADLLQSLGNADELLSFLPYSGDDLDSIFSASDIDLSTLDMPAGNDAPPDLGLSATPTTQIMRFKVPLEDAGRIERMMEATMKAQGFTGEDSLSNAGNALVHLLRA